MVVRGEGAVSYERGTLLFRPVAAIAFADTVHLNDAGTNIVVAVDSSRNLMGLCVIWLDLEDEVTYLPHLPDSIKGSLLRFQGWNSSRNYEHSSEESRACPQTGIRPGLDGKHVTDWVCNPRQALRRNFILLHRLE